MRGLQVLFMFGMTMMVGFLFLVRTAPTDDALRVQTLQAVVRIQQETLIFLQTTPTLVPPTVDVASLDIQGSGANIGTETPTPAAQTLSTPQPVPDDPNAARIVSVDTSLGVTPQDCADNPQTEFVPTDTIYGVANLANMSSGDQLTVRFEFANPTILIYEDSFSIQQGGDYCRWYIVEPDELGWDQGGYTLTYQINEQEPTIHNYQIVAGAEPIPEAPPADDNMDDMDDDMDDMNDG